MGRQVFFALASLSVLSCAPSAGTLSPPITRQPPLAAAAAGPLLSVHDAAALAETVLPATVLILNYRPDGSVTYGAGLIVAGDGTVLTSRHVVEGAKSLGAMIYRADRIGYTPMDGGLSRYIFENQRDVARAELVREEQSTDLAVVRIDADTSWVQPLVLATAPLRVGERVWVIGHPQEAVWSFTSGIVSGLPSGAIQHDAMVSHGSSGGPVLNDRREVVGVSIAKVISENPGFAFARPIAMARPLIEPTAQGFKIDQSTPERAAVTCWRAMELASPALVECFDWEAEWRIYIQAAAELEKRLGQPMRELQDPSAKEQWIAMAREGLLKKLRKERCTKPEPPSPPSPDDVLAFERTRVFSEMKEADERLTRSLKTENGLKEDLRDEQVLLKVMRMGFRVEEIEKIGGARAWVLFTGRNTDGSQFRFTELYVDVGGRWLQRTPPTREERETLPRSWPPPIDDPDLFAKKLLLGLIERMSSTPRC